MRRFTIVLVCAAVMVMVAGCGKDKMEECGTVHNQEGTSVSRDVFAMDTYMTVTAYGANAEKVVGDAVDEINRLDELLGAENENSEVYLANQNGSVILSDATKELVERSLEIHDSTEGAFDITIYPLMEAWGFKTQRYHVPSEERIKELLADVDASKIQLDEENALLTLPEKVKIDLGGIAKGYTSQRIMEIFREDGVESGIVSLGGNVQVYGKKTDGTLWRVAIENPVNPVIMLEFCKCLTKRSLHPEDMSGISRKMGRHGIIF